MSAPILLAVPNVSEGRDRTRIEALAGAFAGDAAASDPRVRLLDVHSDPDHHRSVFTLAAPPVALADAMLRGARQAVATIDVVATAGDPATGGKHPHVGAIDVAPVVYTSAAHRGAACAEALVVAERIAEELDVPVFLYGELTADDDHPPRTRAQLRRGGIQALARRMASGQPLRADFGPPRPHPTGGATLVAARPPLVAFNLVLAAPATIDDARTIATRIREGGERGIPGLRAIGIELSDGSAQVSMNVERPFEIPLAEIVAEVARHAPPASAELVGLAPKAALEGFPGDLPMPGFDPARHLIENAIGS